MWARRIALVVATATVAALGVTAPARAGAQDQPIVADVNGDGLADRNTLGRASGSGECVVQVELGLPGGGHGPVHTYPYLSAPYCPDMGVGINLDDDAPDELVVAWFAGRPPGIPHDLLALDNFAVSAGFRAIFQPSHHELAIETAFETVRARGRTPRGGRTVPPLEWRGANTRLARTAARTLDFPLLLGPR